MTEKQEWGVFHHSSSDTYPRHTCIKDGFTSENKATKVADVMNKKVPSGKFVVRRL